MSKFTKLANQINGLDVASDYEDMTVSAGWLAEAISALRHGAELEQREAELAKSLSECACECFTVERERDELVEQVNAIHAANGRCKDDRIEERKEEKAKMFLAVKDAFVAGRLAIGAQDLEKAANEYAAIKIPSASLNAVLRESFTEGFLCGYDFGYNVFATEVYDKPKDNDSLFYIGVQRAAQRYPDKEGA